MALDVWIMARSSYHIGASGLIYAFTTFLFFSGILRKYLPLIAISLLVAFLYGACGVEKSHAILSTQLAPVLVVGMNIGC
jgi:membrane associated rhomboid family serine protease